MNNSRAIFTLSFLALLLAACSAAPEMQASYANHDPSVLQVLPPLIIQESEACQVLAILDGMLSGLVRAFS